MMFRIVEETAEFLLVDKSPEVGFHREGDSDGLLQTVRRELRQPELYPVHRLDKITSGLVVFAKSAEVNRELSMQFQARQVQKFYLAISVKKPKKKQGLISGDMARSRRGSWKLMPSKQNPAVTQFFSQSLGAGERLFLLKPATGKTHQLRVALKSLGAAILGDLLYGDEGQGDKAADRGYLHAYGLGFRLQGRDYRFICPPLQGHKFTGTAVTQALAAWGDPWAQSWPKL